MNRSLLAVLACAMLVTGGTAGAQEAALDTAKQRFSYGLGMQIAQSLVRQKITDVDAGALALAVEDMLGGREPRLSIDELRAAVKSYQAEAAAVRASLAEANKAAGADFMARNRSLEGVVEHESGIQYVVREEGTGERPTETDSVLVHYRGWLLDGTEFDSSYKRGQPVTLGVGEVIPGWQQALMLMPVGSRWEVWVPSDLAYGADGAGATIGPNQTLHFEIQLIAIEG